MAPKRKNCSNSYYRTKKKRCMEKYISDTESENIEVADDYSKATNVPADIHHDNNTDNSECQRLMNDFNRDGIDISYSSSISETINSSSGSFHVEPLVMPENNESLDVAVEDVHNTLNEPKDFYSKIRDWVINNIGKLPSTTTTELLGILIEEGYKMFPKTAHSLLGYKHSINSKSVLTKNGSYGQYVYLGILNGLEKRIKPDIYKEHSIKILVFIDGMKVYTNSKGQLWPIVIKLYDDNYECSPFTAGLFYGDAKPSNVDDILSDFVEEVNTLTTNGININGDTYSFELIALVADGQARAYLKCTRGPTAYFGCERCTTKGVTEGRKRVYPEVLCEKRTKESFINKSQAAHHQEIISSPFTRISDFDPVNDVILDSMHLLYLGVMKSLLLKWIEQGSPYRLKRKKRQKLKELLNSISEYVPQEFQRKIYDLDDVSHWKATQYRFMLLYIGPIVLKFVLDSDKYKHFLLLHVACRILCSQELATVYVDYADELLKRFFQLMPVLYGNASQVMNYHNLIHIADDVRRFQIPLDDFSAFWGENYIGKFKNLVQSVAKPLPQIVNRLNASESSDNIIIKKKLILKEYDIDKSAEMIEENEERLITVNFIKLDDMFITSRSPNNIVQLKNNKIFLISSILLNDNWYNTKKLNNFYVEGFEASVVVNIFKNPCESIDLSICQVNEFSPNMKRFTINKIKNKCLSLQINNTKYMASLLHSS